MRLHFADASTDRGQLLMLAKEGIGTSLFSYAYKDAKAFYEPFIAYWEALATFQVPSHTIIDSGAFTAFSTGKAISPKAYAKWVLEFKCQWFHKMTSVHFMNLDVIGDQDASWVNQSILEELGINPIPIVTFGADKKHLIKALEGYEYIALGGLVPHSRNKPKLKKWLDFCFAEVMKRYKSTQVMPKIHLLGITTDWVLKRYPCYSSDSSSWVSSCLRFGNGATAGLGKLPKYKESDAALAATRHTIRAEIRKYKMMETEATQLWESRGISWG